MHITDLGGHSGCKILLCETEDNQIFVRKISSDLKYNDRLKIQADKQQEFKSETIKAPRVIKKGITQEDLFYFDMEYIQGITLAEYMNTIEIGKVRGFVESIVKNIVEVSSICQDADHLVFENKVKDLRDKLSEKNNPIIDEALHVLEGHSWSRFVTTACHGDLTLENIIVKDNQLYFIDFLDSFYDCWIMDISTLMQDVQSMWSYRFQDEININTLIRIIVFRDILMDTVKSMIGDEYIEVYYGLLLKLIRIYPYTKDERTYQFLNEQTSSILSIIKEGV